MALQPPSAPHERPCAGRADIWFAEETETESAESVAASIAYAQRMCATRCPLAQRAQCARDALTNDDAYGVWAGVFLPGAQHRNRDDLAKARERLRLIAGVDRCYRCWSWFDVAAPDEDSMAAAYSEDLEMPHKYVTLCPQCQASDAAQEQAEGDESAAADTAELVDLPPSSDAGMREFWELRSKFGRIDEETDAQDWLLIGPGGKVEGRYPWRVAARMFGRTEQRFRAMVAEGWTVRRATNADWSWNRPATRARVSA